jgi:hypothetical protein
MKSLIAVVLLGTLAGCAGRSVSPDVLSEWQGKPLYTCCNIRYERPEITDANYHVGATLPFGSPVNVSRMSDRSVTFTSGATTLTLDHSYGREQETGRQYFGKILVPEDPHVRFDTYGSKVQEAITDGRVEPGMTREQVLMSVGYPPTHRTSSLDSSTWVYWYNRWVTFNVEFDSNGIVSRVVGTNAPTRNENVAPPPPTPAPKAKAPARKKR